MDVVSILKLCGAGGPIWSGMGREINDLGDDASVSVLRGLDLTELAKPEIVRGYLCIVHMAFYSPSGIGREEDSVPRVTFFVLDYLKAKEVRDADLESQIFAMQTYVRQQTEGWQTTFRDSSMPGLHGDPFSLSLVARALANHTVGIIFGSDEKAVPTLGDACAIAILKIADQLDLTDPRTVRGVLLTIHSAFASPQRILVDRDKKPGVTLFLLNYLKENVRTAELQKNIQETTKFVETQAAQSGANGSTPNQ